ncbi:MAG: DUF4093 domain-containing protein [Oscillospiraceae bacterium]|nr:DUF4093 domain-containing protein [Oscillospiraceae bacterium]
MKPRIREVVVVEGVYDKNTLLQAVDAFVIATGGFGVFKDAQKKKLLRRLAKERGLVILTDGDGAGFLIRNHLKGILPGEDIKHAYIPDRYGKERRKVSPGKEGKLGVEGMPPDVLVEALRQAGVSFADPGAARGAWLTKADLMHYGLSGTPGCAARRSLLLDCLDLPERLTANGLLEVLGALFDREGFEALMGQLGL